MPLFEADAVLARIIPSGSLEQIIYRVDALHWIEERGVPVINSPRAIERAVDKFYTSALLQEAGLREIFVTAYGEPAKTFPAIFPILSLDRIYVRNCSVHLPVVLPRRPWSHLSDHAPLVAEIHL